MADEAFFAFADRAYQPHRAAEAAWLRARLMRTLTPKGAVGVAGKSMRRRCKAARDVVEEALGANPAAIATVSASDIAGAFDRLAGADQAPCINAVAEVAGRFVDPQATLGAVEVAVGLAFARGRAKALKQLSQHAEELLERQRDKGRPMPAVIARRGVGWLFGGGAIWSAGGWLSWHWPAIESYVRQAQHFFHH